MESANLHDHHQQQQHHQLEEQFVGCSFAAESGHGVSIPHHLSPSMTWNTENYNIILNEIPPNSKGLWTKRDGSISPISKTSQIQDLGLCDQRCVHDDDLRDQSHWLNSFSSADHQLHSNAQIGPARFGGIALSNNSYNFSHVFPSTNISNQDLPLLLGSSSLGMSFQALDPLTSRDGGKRFSLQSLDGNFGFMKEKGSSVSPSSSCNKASATRNEVTRVKRFGWFSEPKAYSQEPAKKPRNVAKLSSAAPFKVRKEKLGDKIAALHRLVAPFGKTDAASVLTEVIEYIQFLQFQIKTLSLLYMKSTPTMPFTTILPKGSSMENEKGEMKQDLRSRGLCLVPISFVSYISSYNNVGGAFDLTSYSVNDIYMHEALKH